jgi:hypothetical protein
MRTLQRPFVACPSHRRVRPTFPSQISIALIASAVIVNPLPPAPLDLAVGRIDDTQPPLPPASDGVLRWVWNGRFGEMLIEVIGSDVFVNGVRVTPHDA